MAVELRTIDFASGSVTTSDSRVLPITDLFDDRGRPTRHSGRAVLCVAGHPGAWLSFKLAAFDPAHLQ